MVVDFTASVRPVNSRYSVNERSTGLLTVTTGGSSVIGDGPAVQPTAAMTAARKRVRHRRHPDCLLMRTPGKGACLLPPPDAGGAGEWLPLMYRGRGVPCLVNPRRTGCV